VEDAGENRLLYNGAMVLSVVLLMLLADVRECACDPQKPETLEARACSLCQEAEKQPADLAVFFLKDVNPTKANRTLALPRKHYPGQHSLEAMPAAERTALWTGAIAKAKELWGDQWGIAMNGEERRTQCHMHLHIGKLTADAENERFVVVNGPAGIPLTGGVGLWVHPVEGKLHVHSGEQVTEFVLMR
jgi:diadenosine tetraphosphate (Ap4A) HIT family hydrolase